ncbi:MAG: methylase of chemotaxis methyl-accepting protein [Fibrobacteres bacterium]|nr:methylase of chemotaxis methyl-accepting protein [Fibrobacterota bacterium]
MAKRITEDAVDAEFREVHVEKLEPILEAILERYGYDFRDYARPSLDRRIRTFMKSEDIADLGGFRERILTAQDCMQRFLLTMSVNVTSMFRDPEFYINFRRDIIPVLRTYPFIRIWHAGCSTGQEVYSMAILLAEEGLIDRCRIYATDMDETVLRKARDGIFSLTAIRKYTQNYIAAGGKRAFSDYYTAKYNSAIINSSLRKNIVFGQHNLVSDGSFNEFQVIFCRNVLIFFNSRLQERVLELIHQSLGMFGYLGLGTKESISLGGYEGSFQELDAKHRLYRKIA